MLVREYKSDTLFKRNFLFLISGSINLSLQLNRCTLKTHTFWINTSSLEQYTNSVKKPQNLMVQLPKTKFMSEVLWSTFWGLENATTSSYYSYNQFGK